MHAIVLAGGSGQDEFARRHGATNKALIPIGSKSMLAHVLDALLNSRFIDTLVVVGPVDELQAYAGPRVQLLADTGDMVGNCLAAVRALSPDGRVVVATSDIPMMTTAVLDSYLASIEGREGDFFYPIIKRETNELRYPGAKRTYATLREGTFTGGNLFVVKAEIAERIGAKMREIVAMRKSVMSLGAIIGIGFAIKLLAGQLTIAEVEQRVTELLGCQCVAVICPHPEIGTDIDKDSDLELARRAMVGA